MKLFMLYYKEEEKKRPRNRHNSVLRKLMLADVRFVLIYILANFQALPFQ